jgi:hypothetical protein
VTVVTEDLLAAAARLAETIATENAALAALDLPAAVAAGRDKQRATDAFTAALHARTAPIEPDRKRQAEAVVRQLNALAQENRGLLERAIAAQSRVIEIIARAARREMSASVSRYSAYGAPLSPACPRPMAILARA